MKPGEYYKEINQLWRGRQLYIKLIEYLGEDKWRVHCKIEYKERETLYNYSIIAGQEIYKYFVKISEA